MSPQTARANCQQICYKMQSNASTMAYESSWADVKDHLSGGTAWCTGQDIEGMGTGVTCPGIGERCFVTFNNSVQKEVTC